MTTSAPTRPPAGAASAPASPSGTAPPTLATRRAGLTAGVALLLLAALAAVGLLVAVEGLVSRGDAARTAEDIAASATRFRLGVAALYLVVVLDVVAAWALYRFFAPVDLWLSRLSAWLRLAYSGVFLVAIAQLAGVPDLLTDPDLREVIGAQQLQGQVMMRLESFDDIWMAGLLLFGAHLALLGLLAYRSGYVPRVIGVLLVVAGAGYASDTITSVLLENPVAISAATALGELVLAVWLVLRAGRVELGSRS